MIHPTLASEVDVEHNERIEVSGYGAYDEDDDTGWWGPRGQELGSFGGRRR